MKKSLLLIVVIMALFIGCEFEASSDEVMKKETEQSMSEANRQIGMPNIVNFQERKLAKMIFELRDKEDLVCYAYIKSDYSGKLNFIGKCLGFGLPYSVQYTNPMKRLFRHSESTIPQADPNGLFMPDGLSATWLMMIDPNGGEPRPVYVEPEIVVSPFKLH